MKITQLHYFLTMITTKILFMVILYHCVKIQIQNFYGITKFETRANMN